MARKCEDDSMLQEISDGLEHNISELKDMSYRLEFIQADIGTLIWTEEEE